jgi:hypothetical protein
MNRFRLVILLLALLFFCRCSTMKKTLHTEGPESVGMESMVQNCMKNDTIHSILITKAEAILTFDNERYEVGITLYSKRDSIIYLSAVNSGFEIIRASVEKDSIKVINRLDKIVYTAPLNRKFGYQYPVSLVDLQNLISNHYLCDYLQFAHDDHQNSIVFDFDVSDIRKRIILNRIGLDLNIFEFYNQKTDLYLMGEKSNGKFKIYSNFMITEFEIIASGGNRSINRDIEIKMDVNPRKYSFTELQ